MSIDKAVAAYQKANNEYEAACSACADARTTLDRLDDVCTQLGMKSHEAQRVMLDAIREAAR